MVPMSFEKAYTPLRYFNWLAGLRRFECPYCRRPWRSLASLLYLILILAVCSLSLYYTPHKFFATTNPFEKTLRTFYFYAQTPTLLLILVFGWFKTKSVDVYFRRLRGIDATLRRLGAPTLSHRTMYHTSIVVPLLITCHAFVQLLLSEEWCTDTYRLDTSLFFVTAFLYGKCGRSVMVLDYVVNVRLLGQRFKQTNELLHKIVSIASDVSLFHPQKTDTGILQVPMKFIILQTRTQRNGEINGLWIRHSLQIIKQIHLELTKTGRIMNRIFGAQILIEMAWLFVNTVILLYAVYQSMRSVFVHASMSEFVSSMVLVSVCLSQLGKIAVMNYVSEVTKREVNKTKEIIHSLERTDVDYETQLEICQFSLQLKACVFQCSALGLANLNNEFFHEFCGAVTTYLVIIIQMGDIVETQIKEDT